MLGQSKAQIIGACSLSLPSAERLETEQHPSTKGPNFHHGKLNLTHGMRLNRAWMGRRQGKGSFKVGVLCLEEAAHGKQGIW